MRRFIRYVVISLGVAAALCIAVVLSWRLFTEYRYELSVASISKKLATVVVSSPQIIWDTDLHPYGFPDGAFDSPYLEYTAPGTVAMSDSIAAVTFKRSSYAGNQLVEDIHLVTLSIADGSVLKSIQWPEHGPLGLSPGVFCCTKDDEFYAHDDMWLLIKNGEVISKKRIRPVGPNTQQVKVTPGYNNRPATVEISHEDRSKSSFQTDCGNVMDSFVSKTTLVIIGCGTVSIIGTDGHPLFSDIFNDAYLNFGGASKNGKRFVIAVSSLHPGDPPYLTDEWLAVYDVDRRALIVAFKSDPLPYEQSQSALSADGERLLIGTGGHLKLIRLFN